MKVKELIKILTKLDQEKEIIYLNNDYEEGISTISIGKVIHSTDLDEYKQGRYAVDNNKDLYIISGLGIWEV